MNLERKKYQISHLSHLYQRYINRMLNNIANEIQIQQEMQYIIKEASIAHLIQNCAIGQKIIDNIL